MWGMSIMHWVVVAGVVSVLFGRNKITSVMKDLGGGIKAFKSGMSEALDGPVASPPAKLEDKTPAHEEDPLAEQDRRIAMHKRHLL